MPEATDILVVGAGPAGLAAALRLDQVGYRVTIVAPAAPPVDHRTSALLAGSVSFLEALGIWDAIAAEAAPLTTLRIADGTGRLIRAPEVTFQAGEIGLEAFGYNIPNVALVGGLADAVARRRLARIESAVASVTVATDRITAILEDGRELVARLVVAADGRRSRVRAGVGIDTREWAYDQAALVVNLRHTLPHRNTSTEFHTEAGPFTLVPLLGLRSSLVWVDRPDRQRLRLAAGDTDLAREIEDRAQSILGAVSIDGPRQAFPLSGMTANRFAANRAVLVGEAAHLFPPIGAQGLNLGYRDVAALADVLGSHPQDPGAEVRLRAYDRARRADVATRTAAVDALNRTLLNGFLPVQALRGLGLFLLDRVPSLRQAMMRQGVAVAQ